MTAKTDLTGRFVMPAEWYPQSGVQLTWPHRDTDWAEYLEDITETYLQMTAAIASRELVLIATPHPDEVRRLLEERLQADIISNIRLYPCASNDTWARDHGAITLIRDDERRLLDFRFNGWGEKFPSDLDNAITRNLFAQGAFKGCLVDNDDFVLEGGSIESDGKGTILTTSCCLLAPNRNQPLSRDEIEEELKARLGAERVLWLDYGSLDGDDTDGHIDTLVRMAPNDTLVYCGAGDANDTQHDNLVKMREQLATLLTADGMPFRLIELPLPSPIYDDGYQLPATYANYLIINGAVLMPTYGQPENDAEAARLLGEAYPCHEIIGIDARTVVRQHGSLHCLTMQYPTDTII